MTSWESVFIYSLAGWLLTAPIGPLGLLALHKRQQHRQAAYALAAGVILADGMMSLLAVVLNNASLQGISAPAWLFKSGGTLIGLLLLGLALRTWLEPPKPLSAVVSTPYQHRNNVVVGLSMTLFNPADVLGFVAAFWWLHSWGVPLLREPWQVAALTIAIVTGTLGMWVLLLDVAAPMLERRFSWLTRWSREVTAGALVVAGLIVMGRGWS